MKEEFEFEVFPWNNNFEVGNNEIDEQHKKLSILLNMLANTLIHNKEIEVTKAFSELAEYANYHFEAEEQIWTEYLENDPSFVAHKNSHDRFLPKVLEMKSKLEEEGKALHDVIEEVVKFLIRWLAFHIIDDDKRLAIIIDEIKGGKSLSEAKEISNNKMNGSFKIIIETILGMYDGLSTRTLNLMRERHARIEAEKKLKAANEELAKLAITDQLTGLHNRRHFDAVLDQELENLENCKRRLGFIIFDLDFFKRLNDSYGHVEGDKALIKVADLLKSINGYSNCNSFRVGGEEFAIIYSGEEDTDFKGFSEKIREEVHNLKIDNEKSDISDYLSISLGLIIASGKDNEDKTSILKKADHRLYKAKELGRNQVVDFD